MNIHGTASRQMGFRAMAKEVNGRLRHPNSDGLGVAAARGSPAPVGHGSGAGGGAGEFFARLGPGWPLTGLQRTRLAPLAAAALADGWKPAALAAFVGANTAGVRSPAAVLAARLSAAELPLPPGRTVARRPWCGSCDERTRRVERADGADGGRCPRCHPLAVSGGGESGAPGAGRGSGAPWRLSVRSGRFRDC
jgi:hypothetical protein